MDVLLKYVNVPSVNIRRGYGLKAPIVYELPRGTDITIRVPGIRQDGWTWVERNKYPGLWVAEELLRSATNKTFGLHWSSGDNGEMLDLLSRQTAKGKPVPHLTILGGVNPVDVQEIMRRSPETIIYYRNWYPWGGSSTTNYIPASGTWDDTSYDEGYSFGQLYINMLRNNQRAFITRKMSNKVIHVPHNEPYLNGRDIKGAAFLRWCNGLLDAMDRVDLAMSAFNFPPGTPDYPDGIHEGRGFWSNPDTHTFIRKLLARGGVVNIHLGDLFHRNDYGFDDFLRQRKIRPWLPTDIRAIKFAATEYGFYQLNPMDGGIFAGMLSRGQDLMGYDSVDANIWVYKHTQGFDGDDMDNKLGVYEAYLNG